MENRPQTGRLIFLGNPSPWLKQFFEALQQSGLEIQLEATLDGFLGTPVPKNRVSVVLLENTPASRGIFSSLKTSGRRVLGILVGKGFSKEEALYAFHSRFYALLEDPGAAPNENLEAIKRALTRAETLERAEDLSFAIKSVLLQMGQEGATEQLIGELKTGLAKFERHALQNDYITAGVGATGANTRLPFYKSQALADALLTIEDLARTGTLSVRGTSPEQEGRIQFLQGRPVSAVSGESLALKAVYRMFLWDAPEFSFLHQDATELAVKDQFPLSLREICAEGESLRARFEKIRNQLPPTSLKLELVPAALNLNTSLDRTHFSTLSSVVEFGKVSQILDYNPLPDAVLLESLIGLKKHGTIRVVK